MILYGMYISLGVAVGIISGMVGIGGGALVVPALVFFFGFSQLSAQGTSIALFVFPIGMLGALAYYKQGYVNVTATLLIALGIFIGAYFGAHYVVGLSEKTVTKLFGLILFVISLKMIMSK
ncbi:sulfite exporter TauE/SafE family protein [Patescibacteria group bacterium]